MPSHLVEHCAHIASDHHQHCQPANKDVEEHGGENDDFVELTEQEEVEGGQQA